ncbi:hypothetical protein [Kribbella sp.]|uniref:hypothetical protein n=1 Tax=Kribbella sp. TaxID=1871183 RepID=UPI002D497AC2|nr:hypothetical protein [Kribbella sp.]HZX07332.1 hypothetical protein [Kribbella sp.]
MDMRVLHRTGQWCSARQVGRVVGYDVPILPEYQVAGRATVDRCYLLLDEAVQVRKPVTFVGGIEGWWYVDLVEVEYAGDDLVVHDMYVDLLVPPAVDRYQVLDLDELGDALTGGKITAAQCAEVLAATQRFIHRYLRGPDEGPSGPAGVFPPAEVVALAELPAF